MGDLSTTAYYLTPAAQKAIIDDLRSRHQFWSNAKREAQTAVLKAAIDTELDLIKNQLQHYSSVEF